MSSGRPVYQTIYSIEHPAPFVDAALSHFSIEHLPDLTGSDTAALDQAQQHLKITQ